MLTRLKVSCFKNLADVDVRFGPFTCVTGPNGVGKSNLFDAIQFLSALTELPLTEAALSVRNAGGRTADLRSLFRHTDGHYAEEMSFEAEMIIPGSGVDALGQKSTASTTFLKYSVTLAYRPDANGISGNYRSFGALEIIKEELDHINIGEATKHLLFPHKPAWRRTVIHGRRTTPFISTEMDGSTRVITIHQDGTGGGPLSWTATDLPRTVLSVANTAATPTAVLARREMQSWRVLHLEPSALRRPDEFTASPRLRCDGLHLPSMLYHIAGRNARTSDLPEDETLEKTYHHVVNRLSELINDIQTIWVDHDQRQELLTLFAMTRDGTVHPARELSDGTLRFLAFAVLEMDPDAHGLLCVEEPENGIHPERIPAMIRLLRDIAVDASRPAGPTNPPRQVIINTHAPTVLSQITDDSFLIAEPRDGDRQSQNQRLCFSSVRETWRQKAHEPVTTISRDDLLSRLNLVIPGMSVLYVEDTAALVGEEIKEKEEPDLQLKLF
ncbi:uncharacterized protein METZ01_LOCUS119983 [marine metagenome]|uniref:ATPase AAA-type core domain-containing protein n=1 Tax=marine metagenome TaxID=408172 RepID=A0A381XQT8_9ZZZZ